MFVDTIFLRKKGHVIIDALKSNKTSVVAELINHSKTSNIGLSTVLNTLKKNQKAVFSAIISPLSNGRIEGINRKIKQIIRTAYGTVTGNIFVIELWLNSLWKLKKEDQFVNELIFWKITHQHSLT